MVYKEGTKFIACQPKTKLAEMALKYIKKEKEVLDLMESIEGAELPVEKKEAILRLLDQGGARTALQMLDGT
jgi:glutamate dehydrogenase